MTTDNQKALWKLDIDMKSHERSLKGLRETKKQDDPILVEEEQKLAAKKKNLIDFCIRTGVVYGIYGEEKTPEPKSRSAKRMKMTHSPSTTEHALEAPPPTITDANTDTTAGATEDTKAPGTTEPEHPTASTPAMPTSPGLVRLANNQIPSLRVNTTPTPDANTSPTPDALPDAPPPILFPASPSATPATLSATGATTTGTGTGTTASEDNTRFWDVLRAEPSTEEALQKAIDDFNDEPMFDTEGADDAFTDADFQPQKGGGRGGW